MPVGVGVKVVQSRAWLVALAISCGIINNASFCVLLGASLEMAVEFGHDELQPLIVNISTLGSIIGCFLSSRLMVGRMTDEARLLLVVAVNVAGYALVATAYLSTDGSTDPRASWGFWLCTGGAFILGLITSCGEVLNLAVYRAFTPEMLAGWGAGTGLSGIVGPFLFIALHDLFQLTIGEVALVMIGFLPFYCAALWTVMRARAGHPVSSLTGSLTSSLAARGGNLGSADEGRSVLLDEGAGGADAGGQESFSWANLQVVWRGANGVMANLVAVYSLEYTVTAGFMQAVTKCPPTRSWLADSDNNNPLLWAMYNVGVTMSRASVSCFRIRRVWILTVLQAGNVAVWAVLASTQWVARLHSDLPLYAAAVHMVFIGFMGGACYSNCMYLFNRSKHIDDRYRELGINLGFAFSNVGIVMATGLVVLLSATVLSKDALFPPDGACPSEVPG